MENEKTATAVRFLGIVEGRAHFERGVWRDDFFLLTEEALHDRIADLKEKSINTDPEETALLALHEEPQAKQ